MKAEEQPNSTSRIPDDFSDTDDTVMSNFDGVINSDIAEAIKGKPLYAQYTGWNFCGNVWWQNNVWCCEVFCYDSWRETFVSETLDGIMSDVCEKYGCE